MELIPPHREGHWRHLGVFMLSILYRELCRGGKDRDLETLGKVSQIREDRFQRVSVQGALAKLEYGSVAGNGIASSVN